MNRRSALKGIGYSLIIASQAGFCLKALAGPLSKLEDKLKAYESNDTIEHRVTSIKIKGWRLLFDFYAMHNYAKQYPEETIEFILHNSGNKNYFDLALTGIPSRPVKGSLGVLIDNNQYYELLAFPDIERQPYLIIREGRNDVITSAKVFPINFDYYTHNPLYENPRSYSEIPIDKETLKRIHEISRSFDAFSNTLPVYIYRFEGDRVKQGYHRSGFDYNRVHSNYFLKPQFEDDGIQAVFHELAHGIMTDKVLFNKEQKPNQALITAYEKLKKASNVHIGYVPKNEFIATHGGLYFSIFTESGYAIEKAKNNVSAGHPWDNHNELFASALTVFRFFPFEFMRRYSESNEQKRGLIKEASRSVFDALEFINPNQQDLRKLLPLCEDLKKLTYS